MRLLFLLLLLANVALFSYEWVNAKPEAGESQIRILEITPERIKLLERSAMPAPTSSPRPAAAAAACLEWGFFAGPDIARVEAAIEKLDLPQLPVRRAIADASGYWVFMPPLKNKAEVTNKVGELKALGVADLFVVQDAGQWHNAISLGIFRTEEAAEKFLVELRKLGVRTAVVERRENFLRQIALMVREPDETTVAKLTAAQRQFPGTEIRAVACPAPGA
jgi:hypothetical protein